MELYGDWCELEEVPQNVEPDIVQQNELIEHSGFGSTASITFSVKKHVVVNSQGADCRWAA